MSIDKNPQARSAAFRTCRGKILKIQELGITPDMKSEDVDKLIVKLANAKVAATEGSDLNEQIKNQRWYVESLIAFSAKSVEDQFESEYQAAFADVGSEAEQMEFLRTLSQAPA